MSAQHSECSYGTPLWQHRLPSATLVLSCANSASPVTLQSHNTRALGTVYNVNKDNQVLFTTRHRRDMPEKLLIRYWLEMIGLNYMYLLISLELYNIAVRLLSPIHQFSSCITLSFAEQFGFDLKTRYVCGKLCWYSKILQEHSGSCIGRDEYYRSTREAVLVQKSIIGALGRLC